MHTPTPVAHKLWDGSDSTAARKTSRNAGGQALRIAIDVQGLSGGDTLTVQVHPEPAAVAGDTGWRAAAVVQLTDRTVDANIAADGGYDVDVSGWPVWAISKTGTASAPVVKVRAYRPN